MPGIINVNKIYDMAKSNRIDGKLSFSVGEAFLARLVKSDEKNTELLLKLLDGWQFSAKLEKPMEFTQKGLIKFEVTGFEQGKLLIKPVTTNEEKSDEDHNSIDSALEEQNINVDKDEYGLLQKMVKYNMPLTKENITKVKTLADFKNKMDSNPEEEDNFISKYLNSKGIEANSDKGKEITDNLKGFFKELKNISEEDLLTLIENGIEVNEENIKSFNKIVKDQGTIYNDSKEIAEGLKQGNEEQKNEISMLKLSENENIALSGSEDEMAVDNKELMNRQTSNNGSIENRNILKENTSKDSVNAEVEIEQNTNSSHLQVKTNENRKIEEKLPFEPKEIEMNQESVSHDKLSVDKNNIFPNDEGTSKLVKEQIENKTAEIKEVLKNLLEDKLNLKPEVYNKVMSELKESINDFKVYNSISNEYYYLDMPLKFKESEYDCKLMIKDERGKGKKIDSKNVKLVVSVNTGAMGMVDSYIKVVNNSMNINIKCDEPWVKVLDAGKEKVLKDVSNIGYSVSIDVNKREQEATLVNCRDFFEDSKVHSINTKV